MTLHELIRSQINLGDYDGAEKTIAELKASDQNLALIYQAYLHVDQGDVNPARKQLGLVDISTLSEFQLFFYHAVKGVICFRLGQNNQAQEVLKVAFRILQELPDEEKSKLLHEEAMIHRNLGNTYLIQVDFDHALESYEEALKIHEKTGNTFSKARILHNLGIINERQGKFDIAYKHYLKAHELYLENPFDHHLVFTLNKLIRINLLLHRREEASKYLAQFEDLLKKTDTHFANVFYNMSMGLYLKSGSRGYDVMASQQFFYQVINDEVADNNTSMMAMIALGQTLIEEFKLLKNEEVAREIIDLSEKINTKAYAIEALHIILELLLIQADFARIKGEISKSDRIMQRALEIAESKHLGYFTEKIKEHIEQSTHMLFGDTGVDLSTRLKTMNVDDYLQDVSKILDRGLENNNNGIGT